MNKFFDQRYLREKQYKTPANLEARIALHRKFGTTNENWFQWVLRQADPQPGARLLEIGCGSGDLWRESSAMLPTNLSLTISDLSAGMLQRALESTARQVELHGAVLDCQNIPFSRNTFDLVIANHMLYHVPDIPKGLSEIRRVLKPGGRLVAATNGKAHMLQLDHLLHRHIPEIPGMRSAVQRFSLENAVEILAPFFRNAQLRIFENNLKVTEAAPLADYIVSTWENLASGEQREAFNGVIAEAQREIELHGFFFIQKSQGLVLATKPYP